jgi:hypothetical protein
MTNKDMIVREEINKKIFSTITMTIMAWKIMRINNIVKRIMGVTDKGNNIKNMINKGIRIKDMINMGMKTKDMKDMEMKIKDMINMAKKIKGKIIMIMKIMEEVKNNMEERTIIEIKVKIGKKITEKRIITTKIIKEITNKKKINIWEIMISSNQSIRVTTKMITNLIKKRVLMKHTRNKDIRMIDFREIIDDFSA